MSPLDTDRASDTERLRTDDLLALMPENGAQALDFPDHHFDLVFCAEVLEHIPSPTLERARAELTRVCRGRLIVGEPFEQDSRVGRTTCDECDQAWGTPTPRSFTQKLLTKAASLGQRIQVPFVAARANWIHLRFERTN